MHWLSEKPCDITGALHQTMITVPKEAEKFRSQAEKDWETMLLARAKELALGNTKNTIIWYYPKVLGKEISAIPLHPGGNFQQFF